MGSLTPRTVEEAYDEMKVRPPILRCIMKFLSGKEVLNARLIDGYWEDIIPNILRYEERTGNGRLKPISLKNEAGIQACLAEFPGVGTMKPLQYVGVKLSPTGTPAQALEQFAAVHGPSLRFLTIDMQKPRLEDWPNNLVNKIKLLLHNCGGIEKLAFKDESADELVPEWPTAHHDLGPFPDLVELETEGSWEPPFLTLLLEILTKAPKLRRISVAVNMSKVLNDEENPIPALCSSPFQNLVVVNLFVSCCRARIFKDLTKLTLKIRHLCLFTDEKEEIPFDEGDVKGFSDWIGKLETLEKLVYFRRVLGVVHFPFRFPQVTHIRKLFVIWSSFQFPIQPSQVPNLEEFTILLPGTNPFAIGSIFPGMKHVEFDLCDQAGSEYLMDLGLGWSYLETDWLGVFPNLKSLSLKLRFGLTHLGLLESYVAQFPTLVNLTLWFGPNWSDEAQKITLWNFFTGGIQPMMVRGTGVEELLATTQPIHGGEVEGNVQNHPFQILRGLKRLEILNCPEIVAFAITKLTAMGMIQHLDELRIELNRSASQDEVSSFIGMLKQYHNKAVISQSLEQTTNEDDSEEEEVEESASEEEESASEEEE